MSLLLKTLRGNYQMEWLSLFAKGKGLSLSKMQMLDVKYRWGTEENSLFKSSVNLSWICKYLVHWEFFYRWFELWLIAD